MSLKRWSRMPAAVLASLLVIAAPQLAWATTPSPTSTLDQSNDVPAQSYLGTVEQQAQTFTAGRDGTLDRVEVQGFRLSGPSALTVQITAVDGSGVPVGAPLGAGSADLTTLPTFAGDLSGGGWLSVDITPPVQVHAGTRYAIVLPATSPFGFVWSLSVGDTYPAGAGSPSLGQPYDYLFRTFVLTPEPVATCEGRDPTIYVEDGMVVGGPEAGKPYTGTLRGGAAADVILGTSGADVISGGNGDDLICGAGGADDIKGANGVDVLIGGDGPDVLDGGNGNDDLTGGADADTFIGGRGADTVTDYSPSDGDTQRSIP